MSSHDSVARLTAIPVYTDTMVPAGKAVLVADSSEPRHVTGIRAAGIDFTLTGEQLEQVRDHYRAMDERAGQLLADWERLMATVGKPRT